MLKFVKRCLFLGIPILLVVLFVNYTGDAANLFSDSYEEKIALKIANGQSVTNVLNCDERLLQKAIIKNLDFCPSVAVIGSSRIMEIRKSSFKNSSVMNNGVSGASIEDLLAIIELYEQQKCLPRKIIIGLDPWTLNNNNEQVRWKSLSEEYELFISRMGLPAVVKSSGLKDRIKTRLKEGIKYYQLISPSYFKSSLHSLFFQDKELKVAIKDLNDTFTKLSDGSVTYDLKYRSASPNDVNRKVSTFIAGGMYSLGNYSELDKNIQSQLEAMLKYLQSRKVVIEFFLAPYHPEVYGKIISSEKYKSVLESEYYFRSLAKDFNIEIKGSFNPTKLNLAGTSFYDGMHCDDKAIRHILENSSFN